MAEPSSTLCIPLLLLYAIVCYLYVFGLPLLRPPRTETPEPNDIETYENLSDQQRMERLVEHVHAADQFQDADGAFLPVCTWPSVECDSEGSVTEIQWNGIWSKVKLYDSIMDLWWLPPQLEKFDIGYSQVIGVFFAAKLPRKLQSFVINACQFEGTVDWASLPPRLEVLDISNTALEGHVDFAALPPTLRQLRLQNTRFSDFAGAKRESLIVTGMSELERRAQENTKRIVGEKFVI